ncbi:MAG TPA: alpha/beta fold hydrolase [Stellaceae bacterium]|jgi:pimeloyl-ACP methyl ester carboxylesterase|nr:alpha/beta fold hydrolase [Stellaceae bacterium]
MALRLAATEYGAGPTVAILHGLFGWGRNWATIAQRLAARHRVVTLDLRNHGNSPWADGMSYAEMAEDVRETLGGEPAALIGHSMGGKAAMVAALTSDWVERLVVVDIAPVDYPAPSAEMAAMQGLDLAAITRRAEADRLMAATIPDPAERGFLLQNLVFEDGRARWRLSLAAIERGMPDILGFPEFPAGTVFTGPTLFVAGAESGYLRSEYEAGISRLFPAAEFASVAHARHWVHAEQPEAFLEVVERFLAA